MRSFKCSGCRGLCKALQTTRSRYFGLPWGRPWRWSLPKQGMKRSSLGLVNFRCCLILLHHLYHDAGSCWVLWTIIVARSQPLLVAVKALHSALKRLLLRSAQSDLTASQDWSCFVRAHCPRLFLTAGEEIWSSRDLCSKLSKQAAQLLYIRRISRLGDRPAVHAQGCSATN